ncbi:AsnC family transcriptional regulator [Brevibacterium sanguinis]|uniref:AsnC family transcriptional regulator n=2 Tax=Brevibacterium TaxID=1696 RepID=A0A366IIN8_9MICO|nr:MULTISPECIES: Lrp/AsnC family transcriptional regulator [Brevibacterium]RBP64927.1 AsnC family transcriptional regulator [Brevibacterium sanguinis]RBP71190.1 AsnC family transcriptional regulator [Brevibacterium celere]
MAAETMDDLDRAIITELEEDGRRAFREIARNVDTSEATVRARVKRLQSIGALQIVAFADPAGLEKRQMSLIFVDIAMGSHNEVVARLVDLPEVSYVSTVTGRADLCVEVATRDNDHLREFLVTTLGSIDGIVRTECTSILKVHKLRYGSH